MPGATVTFSTAPDKLEQLLAAHLPWSVGVLRRIQFTKTEGGTSPNARIVLSSDIGGLGEGSEQPTAFTVSYVDFSSGPDTQMWMYSTLQDDADADGEHGVTGEHEQQINNVVTELIRLRKDYGQELVYPGCVLLGNLHSQVRSILEKSGRVQPRITGDYDSWLFRTRDLPTSDMTLPDGMVWDKATLEDCHFAVSKTDIPRRAETLSRLPSMFIKLQDKTPVAWAFLGQDASLSSLTCEEPYRRQGLSKKLAAKLFSEGMDLYGTDGLCVAHVSADNTASRGVCTGLNGKPSWVVSWILLSLADKEE